MLDSNLPYGIEEWAQRLEAGDTSDPLIELASQLKALYFAVPPMRPAFRKGLSQQLRFLYHVRIGTTGLHGQS